MEKRIWSRNVTYKMKNKSNGTGVFWFHIPGPFLKVKGNVLKIARHYEIGRQHGTKDKALLFVQYGCLI